MMAASAAATGRRIKNGFDALKAAARKIALRGNPGQNR
jgi:hypothetical protein